MSRTRQTPVPPPPPIEDEDEEEIDEDDEGMDPFEALCSLLATEEGETIATSLSKIATQIEMHNKIMIKILASIQKMIPTPQA